MIDLFGQDLLQPEREMRIRKPKPVLAPIIREPGVLSGTVSVWNNGVGFVNYKGAEIGVHANKRSETRPPVVGETVNFEFNFDTLVPRVKIWWYPDEVPTVEMTRELDNARSRLSTRLPERGRFDDHNADRLLGGSKKQEPDKSTVNIWTPPPGFKNKWDF